MKKHDLLFKSARALTLGAMLVAMNVIIGFFCKTFLNFGGGLFRITFENLPVILSGILFGPIVGGAVGASGDLISYLLSPQIYPPNVIVTVGAAAVGIVSGTVSKLVVKKRGRAQIILSGTLAHIIGSMVIKSVGLFQFYGWAVLLRIPTYLCIAALEILLMCLLFENRSFSRLIDEWFGDDAK